MAKVCQGTLYCPQTAALLTGSIVSNITWGLAFDRGLFQQVAAGCCLVQDFHQFVNGEETIIGEAGVNLSGGQKARICLARVIYAALCDLETPQVLLLDDPLAAVDNQTGRALLKFLRSLPSEIGIIMSSHHTHLIRDPERVAILDHGRILCLGGLSEVLRNDMVSGTLAGLFPNPGNEPPYSSIHNKLSSFSSSLSPVIGEESPSLVDQPTLLGEEELTGEDEEGAQVQGEEGQEEEASLVVGEICQLHEEEKRVKGRVSFQIYLAFFSTAPWRWGLVAVVLLLAFFTQLSVQLSIATVAEGMGGFTVYIVLSVTNVTLTVVKLVLLFVQAIASCSSLHHLLLTSIARLTKQAIDTTPSGFFITRFSEDLNTIDNKIAVALDVFVRLSLDICQVTILGALGTHGLFAAVVVLVGGAALALGHWYGKSSIELARSLAITRSPVQTRIVEISRADSCIRAFRQERRWMAVLTEEVWTWVSVVLMTAGANRWLNMRLTFLGGIGVWMLAFLAVFFNASVPVAYIALGLAFALELRQNFNIFIQSCVQLENAMQSCERIREFAANLDQEPAGGCDFAPTEGRVQVEHLSLTYRPGLPPSLTDVSFEVHPGERLGICGRTGSGKSSVIRALLRLVPYTGRVIIDGQDIADARLSQLRALLPTVTQSAFTIRGCVRDLIDPARQLSDDQVGRVMGSVGLEVALDESSLSLSAGELQLCSFCRALASVFFLGARVLILDEASSAVDKISEGRMLDTVFQQSLNGCSVIVIAHRIETIMSCDRLVVLEAGRLIETGPPSELDRPGTHFHALIHASRSTPVHQDLEDDEEDSS
ncbi:MAG: ATP-binding cassette domain-containing protein [archaeon]|nr:ATP-binding cassette domain-containing protein [archaeon]